MNNKKDEIESFVNKWVKTVSAKQPALNNHSICPFAKTAKFKIVEITDQSKFVPDSFEEIEMVLYILPDDFTQSDVEHFSIKNNEVYKHLIFIPDPKNKKTYIKNIQTNNATYNLVFCQPKATMIKARNHLKKIGYYSQWSKKQLQNIFREEFARFFGTSCPYTKAKFEFILAFNEFKIAINRMKTFAIKILKFR